MKLRIIHSSSLVIIAGVAAWPAAAAVAEEVSITPRTGPWRAWLDSPGGELPFGLELARDGAAWTAAIINGSERLNVPIVRQAGHTIALELDYFDASIHAAVSHEGTRLDGEWKRRSGPDSWAQLPFHATAGHAPRFKPLTISESSASRTSIDGRWRVTFDRSRDPAVGLFEQAGDGTVTGTFLTTTGDYRYLAGQFESGRLRLSCFDGAHAFLFDAELQLDGTLQGAFWSRDTWHERWTAHRDAQADLADAYTQTQWTAAVPLADLSFPDLSGTPRSLNDPAFAGRARVIEIFGTWCPNCYDASRYLSDLHDRYAARGLSIVALAFEVTGDAERDTRQVQKYVKRLELKYPVLLAGVSDKSKASKSFPLLDEIRSYPTTIFLHADGRIRAVHTGFTGPATGQAYRSLQAEFESIIEELLAE